MIDELVYNNEVLIKQHIIKTTKKELVKREVVFYLFNEKELLQNKFSLNDFKKYSDQLFDTISTRISNMKLKDTSINVLDISEPKLCVYTQGYDTAVDFESTAVDFESTVIFNQLETDYELRKRVFNDEFNISLYLKITYSIKNDIIDLKIGNIFDSKLLTAELKFINPEFSVELRRLSNITSSKEVIEYIISLINDKKLKEVM